MSNPDEPYVAMYMLDDEIHLNQYARGEDEEEFIWMDRTADELLECERDNAQKYWAETYDIDYDFSW